MQYLWEAGCPPRRHSPLFTPFWPLILLTIGRLVHQLTDDFRALSVPRDKFNYTINRLNHYDLDSDYQYQH